LIGRLLQHHLGIVGLQAGVQSKALIFSRRDAGRPRQTPQLRRLGVDASVAVVKVGANGTIDTTTATAPVQAFVLTKAGLMADVSLAGTKVLPLKI
jgi:lipid-binding SYLF domain-containing protein